jgi:hypothetical protein
MVKISLKGPKESLPDYAYLIFSFAYLSFLIFWSQGDRGGAIMTSYAGAYVLPFFYIGAILAPVAFFYLCLRLLFSGGKFMTLLLFVPLGLAIWLLSFIYGMALQIKMNPLDAGNLMLFGPVAAAMLILGVLRADLEKKSAKDALGDVLYSVLKPFGLAVLSIIAIGALFYIVFGTAREFSDIYQRSGLPSLLFAAVLISVMFGLGPRALKSGSRAITNKYLVWFINNLIWMVPLVAIFCVATVLLEPTMGRWMSDMQGYFSMFLIYFLYLFPGLAYVISVKWEEGDFEPNAAA